MKRPILVSVLSLAVACSESPASEHPTVKRDASATLACRNIGRILDDTKAGILTETELRMKIKGVHEEYARVIDRAIAPGVAENLTAMLAAVTSGTTAEATTAISGLTRACNAMPK